MEVGSPTLNTGWHHSNVTSGSQHPQRHACCHVTKTHPLPSGCSCGLFHHSNVRNTEGHERPEQRWFHFPAVGCEGEAAREGRAVRDQLGPV